MARKDSLLTPTKGKESGTSIFVGLKIFGRIYKSYTDWCVLVTSKWLSSYSNAPKECNDLFCGLGQMVQH